MLKYIKFRDRYIPVHTGSCACTAGNEGPVTVLNKINVAEGLIILSTIQIPSIICVLTTCTTSVLSTDDDNNAHGMTMKAQKKLNKNRSLYSIQKKVTQGHEKYLKFKL